ncbi:MAG: fatty acid desaturase [Burkholderiaceae bacterium]
MISEFLQRGLTQASWLEMIVFTLVVTHITIIGVTVYLHRCQAHRALDVHPALAHFFRFWMWLTTGMGTRAWAAIHRKHHAKCETPEDPHSPQVFGLKKVFWEGAELYRAESKNTETLSKYGHGTPDDWLERAVYVSLPWQGLGLMLIVDFLLFGLPGVSIWAVQMLWIPILAAGVINGIGHYWGYRNFDCPDASRNIFPWGILIGGEELHNNHHTHATSAKLSNKWYEFDIGWVYIRLFMLLGLAKVKKVAPRPLLKPIAKPVLDLESVQAVVNNRYDMLAKYAKTLKKAYAQEWQRLRVEVSAEERRLFSCARRWLHLESPNLNPNQRESLNELFKRSEKMKILYDMRTDLRTLWEKSNLSREQMLHHLQQWCERAEASGIRLLEELAMRVRRYG